MKSQVWIAERVVEYEPGEILGVASTEQGAYKLVERLGWRRTSTGEWVKKHSNQVPDDIVVLPHTVMEN